MRMSEKAEFKVPTILLKNRKSDLPRTVSKVDIPLPTNEEPDKAETFDQNVAVIPPVPYKEPTWSHVCDPARKYSFEVEKNGLIIDEIKQLQSKPYWLFGRLPNCDINITHPTSSRYHAVLQYHPPSQSSLDSDSDEEQTKINSSSKLRGHTTIEPGWYIYDLNSTHGTFLNKQRIIPRTYVRVRVGYMIKLGLSSRTYILQGPSDDEDEPSAFTVTELKEQAKKQMELREEIAEIERQEKERIEKLKESEGISWGMAEDADEETDLTENPYAVSSNEELFLDDPKKTLRGYFEREGYDLEYRVDELSSGTYCCKIELPIDDTIGRPVVAEVSHKGKKKEAVLQCAMEACRILDRHGLLRQANHEPRRRRCKQSDSDDDDEFLDRTGAVEKRRQRKDSKQNPKIRTYKDLIHDEARILERLEVIEDKIQNSRLLKKDIHLPENVDDVDKLLEKLSGNNPIDKFDVSRLRQEQAQLREDLETVKRIIKKVEPVNLESILLEKKDEAVKQKVMPLFGKRNKLGKTFGIRESNIKAEKDNDTEVVSATDNADKLSIILDKSTVKQEFLETSSSVSGTGKTFLDQEASCSYSNQKKRSAGLVDFEAIGEPIVSSSVESEDHACSKKKRLRHRMRENRARENVDYDDSKELASDDKNVEWLPPSGQTGDGRTSLNEKYGY